MQNREIETQLATISAAESMVSRRSFTINVIVSSFNQTYQPSFPTLTSYIPVFITTNATVGVIQDTWLSIYLRQISTTHIKVSANTSSRFQNAHLLANLSSYSRTPFRLALPAASSLAITAIPSLGPPITRIALSPLQPRPIAYSHGASVRFRAAPGALGRPYLANAAQLPLMRLARS